MQRNEGRRNRQEERSRAGRIRPGAVLLLLLAGFSMLVFAYLFHVQMHRKIGPKQPIPFSHRLHAGVKAINCRFCHPFVARSARAGIPAVAKCLYCHNYIIRNHPWIQEEHRYYETGEPVPWKRLFIVGDHVQFRHQPHILLKGFDCSECHGAVETMDRLPHHEFKMGFCIDCHRKNDAPVSCWLTCHN
jgi:hypothetical protein